MPTRAPLHHPRPRPRPPDTRASASRRGYGASWRRLRSAHLARHPLCEDCLARDRLVPATQVDHALARAQGGTDVEANLRSLCASCHSRKTVLSDRGLGRTPG